MMNHAPLRSEARAVDRLVAAAWAPVDPASLVVFRIAFGLVMAWWCSDELRTGRVHELYELPRFHFSYYLFDFVQPWPGAGMTAHFLVLLLLALCIAAGFFYRLSTLLFALGFTYFFLLERTNYQNHYYLLVLLSWTLALLPARGLAMIDAEQPQVAHPDWVPAWCLGLVRFHVALPYVFGGVAKLHPDWFAGEPLRTHLNTVPWPYLFRPLLTSEFMISFITWGGLLFDLAIVPLLMWRRTRALAYVLCLGFHLTNAFLFEIHVFPWFMILATTIFFRPDWPRRWLSRPAKLPVRPTCDVATLTRRYRVFAGLLVVYCLAHMLIPLRPFFYTGDSCWTERGHHFSWRMMLRTKSSTVQYYLTDRETNRTGMVDVRHFVTPTQALVFPRDPEMILHLAHFIGHEYRQKTGRDAAIHALVFSSLNGRKPQLLIDPKVDLMREPRGFHYRPWIMPLTEPLRSHSDPSSTTAS